jgi:hypothetical protein
MDAREPYRAYRLKDGELIAGPATVIDANDDSTAIEQAKQMVDGHDIEVWRGPHLLATLKHKDAK